MAKLIVDFDVLSRTITEYENSIQEFRDVEKKIKKVLAELKSSGWDSNAGKQWFSLLDDEWISNIEFQIRTLESLKKDLETARTEYQKVLNRQKTLDKYL